MKARTGYLHRIGSNFYVSWRVDGKLHKKALKDDEGQPITTRREAEIAQAKFMAPIALASEAESLMAIATKANTIEKKVEASQDAVTIDNAWGHYLRSNERPTSGEATLYQYECQWNRFRKWIAEKHPTVVRLNKVTKAIADEYLSTLNHGVFNPGTYNKHLNLLKLVFRVLKDKALLSGNVWDSFVTKDLAVNSRRELSQEQLRTIVANASGELKTLIALGTLTGMRLGDCCLLRWCEINTRKGIIERAPNKTSRRYPDRKIKVPIHPALKQIFSEIPINGRGEYVLPEMSALYLNRSDLVTDKIQKLFRDSGINVWKPGTGVNGKRAVIEIGFHSLRHTFVGACADSGVPLAVVQKLVGHGSPAMTDHYLNVPDATSIRAVAALPAPTAPEVQQPDKLTPDAIVVRFKSILTDVDESNMATKIQELKQLLAQS